MTTCKHKWRQARDGSLYCEKCPATGAMKYVDGFRYVMLENESSMLNFGKFFCGKPKVVSTRGTDKIIIPLECPSAFPGLGLKTYLTIETSKDYGAKWLKEVLGVEDFETAGVKK